jgi:hypothetical protein
MQSCEAKVDAWRDLDAPRRAKSSAPRTTPRPPRFTMARKAALSRPQPSDNRVYASQSPRTDLEGTGGVR